VIQSAIEDYAQELAVVTRRFLKAKAWPATERIAMAAGFVKAGSANSRLRAPTSSKADGIKVDMVADHKRTPTRRR